MRFAPRPAVEVVAHRGASAHELKDPRPGMPRRVLAAIDVAGVRERVVVQSFHGAWLRRSRALDPGVPVARLIAPWRLRRAIVGSLDTLAEQCSGIGVWHRSVDAALVAEARSRGLVIRAWTVNDPDEVARLTAIGVDGVITDAPGRALAAARLAPLARAA